MSDRMNQHDHQPPDRDELRDRLIDAALRERLSGETPPDLSAVILSKASEVLVNNPSTVGDVTMATASHRTHSRWPFMAVAATLLIAGGWLILPAVQAPREAARRSPSTGKPPAASAPSNVFESLSNSPNSGEQQSNSSSGLPSPYHLTDDAQYYERGEEFKMADKAAAAAHDGPAPTQQNFAPTQAYPQTSISTDAPPYAPTTAIGVPAVSPAAAPAGASWDTMYQVEQGQGQANGQPAMGRLYAGSASTRYGYAAQEEKANVNASGKEPGLQGLINDAYSTETFAWHDQATNRDQYARIHDNPFLPVTAANTDHRLSTFSIDVDTASYANVRQFLMQSHTLPPPDAVRIEELVNYFDYDYTPPTGDVPFAANVEVAGCPWAPDHRLVRVGIKGREMERNQRPLSNLVFLIDVSGSMNEPNKLPLLVEGMKQLTRELGENDRVAIVVYASTEGLALDSTLGTDQSKILAALDQLQAGGSTAGGAGIQLAYKIAQQNFIKGAVNRVILCTDGDFNVGVTSPAELERMAETNAKETGVFLTVLGFGRGNLNDAMMEQVADKGNGNYHYIDTRREAGKVLVEEMTGTLVTIAKDVKIQVEFNPAKVAGYRLIGYENRVLAAEDFNDDKKDAGEIGAGHTVTALYEIVPVGKPVASTSVDELKYAPKATAEEKVEEQKDKNEPSADDKDEPASDELLTLKIRYKAPDGDVSSKLEFPIVDAGGSFAQATNDFKFAASVASFGMLLRNSEHKGNATYAGVIETAAAASKDRDPHGYRQEFVEIVKRAQELAGE
jgi:Ca-activated chloride channel family protein